MTTLRDKRVSTARRLRRDMTDAERSQAARDSARDAFFAANGYRVLRFWNHDVMRNLNGVLTVVAEAIDGQAAAPHP